MTDTLLNKVDYGKRRFDPIPPWNAEEGGCIPLSLSKLFLLLGQSDIVDQNKSSKIFLTRQGMCTLL